MKWCVATCFFFSLTVLFAGLFVSVHHNPQDLCRLTYDDNSSASESQLRAWTADVNRMASDLEVNGKMTGYVLKLTHPKWDAHRRACTCEIGPSKTPVWIAPIDMVALYPLLSLIQDFPSTAQHTSDHIKICLADEQLNTLWNGQRSIKCHTLNPFRIFTGWDGDLFCASVPYMSPPPPMGMVDPNPCDGKKPTDAFTAGDNYFANTNCTLYDGTNAALEQAGANVTVGYQGMVDATGAGRMPITEPFWKEGLCPVNVHWHVGAEHLSLGEYDEAGMGPDDPWQDEAAGMREGFRCHHYNQTDYKYTAPYAWKHCSQMTVGQTYEVHWPHSAAGACGTPYQYQTPFYDGVFCNDGIVTLSPLNTYQKIGVQSQVFTVVNDENYYYPDLIKGMIVDGAMGHNVAKYTGSTTGTTRNNEICSKFTPITWQVDRKCHLISASSFDKMCEDMKAQRDDMSGDIVPKGSRKLVADQFAANNHHRRKLGE